MSSSLRDFLHTAERSVAEATARVAAQRDIVGNTQANGDDVFLAAQLLRCLEENLVMLVDHRDQVLALLGRCDRPGLSANRLRRRLGPPVDRA